MTATLSSGQAATSFIDFGAVWKYLDDGSDQSFAWRYLAFFDDTPWPSGPAQLGYGGGDEATRLYGANNRITTCYFRQAFKVDNPAVFTNLLVRLIRADGGAVYLNGTNVFRSNMPTGEVYQTNFALSRASATDGTTNFYCKTLDPGLLVVGSNLVAVEVHQAYPPGTNVSFDLALLANYAPRPRSARLTNPTNGQSLKVLNLCLTTVVEDRDGAITNVGFYSDNTKLGDVPSFSTLGSITFTWSNVPPGSHVLKAVATSDSGQAGTSAPVTITVIAPPPILHGSDWKYYTNSADPGALWTSLAFDDSGWSNGTAVLGFGNGDETNVVGAASDTNITYYFRHSFEVPDPSAFSNLVVRLMRQDGGIVYLNGVEVFRSNLPEGPVTGTTPAPMAAEDLNTDCTTTYYATNVSLSRLRSGHNVAAVEIHRVGPSSSYLRFDLELLANVPPTPPAARIFMPANNSTSTAPATVTIKANASDLCSAVAAVEFYVGGISFGQSAAEPYNLVVSNLDWGYYSLRAVAIDQYGLRGTSAPVAITVVPPTMLVATGSVWKYLDDGSDQSTAWRSNEFDARDWFSGRAKFGAVKTPYATPIRVGPTNNTTNFTTYFRTSFKVTDTALYTNLLFKVVRDDGVVVYLNGADVFRMNMPSTPITYMTQALTRVFGSQETTIYSTNINASYLREGTNVLAVELHQYPETPPTLWDAGFDLSMEGSGPPPVNPPKPRLYLARVGRDIVLYWLADGFVLVEASSPAGPYQDVVPRVTGSPFTIPAPANTRFYGLRVGP